MTSAGGHASDLRNEMVNQRELQREIEEEIGGHANDPYIMENDRDENMLLDQSGRSNNKQMEETCTSDFYQVPIQGGIPV